MVKPKWIKHEGKAPTAAMKRDFIYIKGARGRWWVWALNDKPLIRDDVPNAGKAGGRRRRK